MTLNFLPMKLLKPIYKACSPAMKAIAIKLLFNLTVKLSCQGQMQFICSFVAPINCVYADMVKNGFC